MKIKQKDYAKFPFPYFILNSIPTEFSLNIKRHNFFLFCFKNTKSFIFKIEVHRVFVNSLLTRVFTNNLNSRVVVNSPYKRRKVIILIKINNFL